MKKFYSMLFLIIICFSLTACSNIKTTEDNMSSTCLTTVSEALQESHSVEFGSTESTTEVLTEDSTETNTKVISVETTASTTEILTTNTEPYTTSSVTTSETTSKPIATITTTTKVTLTKESTTKATTTKPTAAKITTTKATTQKSTDSPLPQAKPSTTKESTTKPVTTKPVTTKPTTTKPATTKESTTQSTTTINTATSDANIEKYCIVRIECNTIYDNISKLKSGKKDFLPSSGIILNNVKVNITGKESAFEVIIKACEEYTCTDSCQYCVSNGVQIEYTYTPAFNNYYIEGIHQIYEKDCGTQSGWMYSVNGEFPDVGSSSYTVSPGDVIVFSFTCNMGEDIGNTF